jgi:serpin B
LSAVLKKMGMPLAFSDEADFSAISSQSSLKISAVIHKAFVDVHEEGTEAAAATAVVMALTAMPPGQRPKPIIFRADRPFLFVIRHTSTNSILFLGRLTNPKAASST